MTEPFQRMSDAVLRVLVAEGFEGVSVRKVATEANVSIGAVQHHFPTKDAMLEGALDRASHRFIEHMTARMGTASGPAEALEEFAVTLVCPSPDEHDISVAWILRLARSAVHEPTAERHRADWLRVASLLRTLITEAAPDVDADTATVELLALLDGLSCSVAVEPDRVPAELAEQVARGHVRRMLAGRR